MSNPTHLILSHDENDITDIIVPPSAVERRIEVQTVRGSRQHRLGFRADRDVTILRRNATRREQAKQE